ncbi:hypothetical protein QYE76_013661 [Lolium multiflorum]|uniref:F-box domain-containing protein n=1 Tax=Lolium multiflorum TaxID=4521 RepID=A0AAD8X7V3_LOLMU|nr:hypothetical protein QYE76_013661 [Lolium multiflorum]
MGRRLPGASPTAPASPLEVDDLLREILLRLPPQPSSLPRASAVCTRWRGLVTDPSFLRTFRVHHRKKPPLLGFIEPCHMGIEFTPILDPPDRIPPERFDLGPCSRAREEQGHLHGSPFKFKVVLVGMYKKDLMACVYSSEAGVWGDLITRTAPSQLFADRVPGIVIGNAIYWLSFSDRIVEFDLDEHSLAVIDGPPITCDFHDGSSQIIQSEDASRPSVGVHVHRQARSTRPQIPGKPCHAWTPSQRCSASDTSLQPLVTRRAWRPAASAQRLEATDNSTSSASAGRSTGVDLEVAGELHVGDGGEGGEVVVGAKGGLEEDGAMHDRETVAAAARTPAQAGQRESTRPVRVGAGRKPSR